MKWLTIIDYGGIGDTFATSVVLSGFRRPDIRICYITRLWDNPTMLACIGPYWDYLCPADPHNPPTSDEFGLELLSRSDWVVNFTPFDPAGMGNFYTARIAQIQAKTGIIPERPDTNPIKRMSKVPVWTGRQMVLIHPFSAWPEKSISIRECLALAERLRNGGLVPVFIGAASQKSEALASNWGFWGRPMDEVISLVTQAKHCICVDSCISHIAYWLKRPLHVFYRSTNSSFLLGGMENPPFIVGEGALDVEKVWQEIVSVEKHFVPSEFDPN